MKKFKKIIKVDTPEEFQKILDDAYSVCCQVYYEKWDPEQECLGFNAYIDKGNDGNSLFKIIYRNAEGKVIEYWFDKDGEYQIKKQPKDCVISMSKTFKIQRTTDILGIKPESFPSASPLLYKNESYAGLAAIAYEYDLSQAYAQMLKLPLPDLNTLRKDDFLQEGEIGFYDFGGDMEMGEIGDYCQWIFKPMESPYKEWAEKLMIRARKAKTKEESNEIKSIYRFAIGDLQNINPFWRATVVQRCNHLVSSLKDENTIYCNTDSIVSTVRRYDLEQDTEFDWKLKRCGENFKWQKEGMNYQWNDETPVYRGYIKRWIDYYNKVHDTPWDIHKDELPSACNHLWDIDEETGKLVRFNYEKGEYELWQL